MNVLITGGCGYVGTKLTQAMLARTDHRVSVLDTQWFGNYLPADPRLTVCAADIRTIDDFDLSRFDTIFHLANIANDPSVDLNPYSSWEVNVLAGMRLIDRAARQGVKQFIFASSASVYGLKSEARVTEDLDLVPLSEYNKTKMVAERVVMSYADTMTTTIIRPATVCGYSPRMRLDLVVNLLTMQALTKGAVTVLGGDQTRPNIHIDDLVDLYLFAFQRRLAGIYNAGFENIAVRDIAALITQQVPADVTVLPSNDPRSYSVCSDRLLATGFRPRKDVATAIREMVAAYRDGRIQDDVRSYNVNWMKQHNFGVMESALIRLLVPLAGASAFFLVSLVTVRSLRPADPKRYFLGYAAVLLAAAGYVYVQIWPLESIDAAAGLAACLLLQALICLTMWNSFYSLLWGFSGGLMHDLYNDQALRDVDRLVGSYLGVGGLDRILARRLPNLAAGGYIELNGQTLRLRWKGRVIAWGTLAAFKTFSLGMGGGVK